MFFEEDGFSTLGAAVAILVTLSLVFSAAQVYRVSSASADVQDVADAAVLAAENEVAEFMIAVRVCDAVSLTLSLTSALSYGIGVVALRVPPLSGVGASLIELGGKVLDARASFAEKAARGLNKLQEALPFLAAASAASVGLANSKGPMNPTYCAVALLVPSEGQTIVIGSASALEAARDAAAKDAASLKQASEEAERAADAANESKERAFARDCGDAPAYCMYERAQSLSNIAPSDNPLFHSADAWSFPVALARAQAYYAKRYRDEAPASSSVEEGANSALRKIFYRYASDEVSKGYVRDSAGGFEASFPTMPKNTSEMRLTSLYTDALFPYGDDGAGGTTLHAWVGCPLASAGALGSLAAFEASGYATCPQCGFSASSMGKVAAASSSIENGFEYHYNAVAQAAREYSQAREALDRVSGEAREKAGGLFSACKNALEEAASMRITAHPPGSNGAIAMVVNTSQAPAQTGFESSFTANAGTLGVRAAVSASTLVEEESDEGKTVVSSLLDGFAADGGGAVGAARVVLDCWSGLLRAYSDGHDALAGTLRSVLDSLPLASASGLGTWAASKLTDTIAALGLAPANLNALKPVLVNTSLVADSDSGAFCARYRSVKRAAESASGSSPSLFSSLIDKFESEALDAISNGDGTVEVVEIEFPVGGVRIPITIELPDYIGRMQTGLIESIAQAARSAVASISGVKEWR